VLKFPNEQYFKIKKYYIQRQHYFCINEKHTVGKYGTTLVYSKNFTLPMYDDSAKRYDLAKVAYGICFNIHIGNALLERNEQPAIIDSFSKVVDTGYCNYNFYQPVLFVKENLYDEKYFKESWQDNRYLDQGANPIVLIGKSETIAEIYHKDWSSLKYGTLISFGFAVLMTFAIRLWNVYDLYPD